MHNRVLPRPDPTALPNEPDLISLEARIRVAATRMPVAGTAKAFSVARARCEGRPGKLEVVVRLEKELVPPRTW